MKHACNRIPKLIGMKKETTRGEEREGEREAAEWGPEIEGMSQRNPDYHTRERVARVASTGARGREKQRQQASDGKRWGTRGTQSADSRQEVVV